MTKRKVIKRSVLLVLLLLAGFAFWYGWQAFPIISGYGAKNMASAVFVQHRKPADILKEDLAGFPFSLATYTVNKKDSSVTGTVWGLGRRKAIYRAGLGCTLVNDLSEADIRAQQYLLPDKHAANDSIDWPYGDRVADSIPASINKPMLEQAISNVLNETVDGKPAYTRAVLVLYDGKIVGEKYAPGFDKNSVMLGWSMSKSFTAALIGVLVKQGKLNPAAPAPVPEWKGTDREKITLQQLLQQTTGLNFREVYSSPSEATNMLFKKGDMAAFTANRSLKHEPGTVFNYSSGNSNILSRIIRQTVGDRNYWSFPYMSLFQKLNMNSVLMEPDASGTYVGSSYSYATARDFARFGLLYYNDGHWNGEQILPDNWVKESIQPAPADPGKRYGYQFWLNGYDEDDLTKRWYPDVPEDMYFADGFGGQNIYIIPSKQLIVVRLGLHNINENKFLREVIAAVHNRKNK